MSVTAFVRGWEVVRVNGVWIYADTREQCWGPDDRRPCKKCGREPTPEGHDACLGTMSGVASACCGHGLSAGWVTKVEELA